MSQEQTPRTTANIQNENAQLTFKAGQIQYVIAQSQKDLTMINDKLRDLALEYVQVQAREAEVAKAVAEAKAANEKASCVDQASTQPGDGTKESASESPVGQG